MQEKPQLLKELRFQLTVTRSMLEAPHLDQILYVILAGLTHGDGLKFNRAVLFLDRGDRRVLRAVRATGPANQAEAHRIWEAIKEEKLTLEGLLERYGRGRDSGERSLIRALEPFALEMDSGAIAGADTLEGLISLAVQTRRCALNNDTEVVYKGAENLVFSKVACVPLVVGEEVIGVIVVDNAYNQRRIEEGDLRGLLTVSNLAAIAIDKGRLHQRLEEMANVDGLTGVFNRRYYEARLEQEITLSRHTGRALALVVVDIDDFKACNDTYGHEHGDQVLRKVASLLREGVRSRDMVARYGGEEFVILLTGGLEAEAAVRVAESLRLRIASHVFPGRTPGDVTASFGVAHVAGLEAENSRLFAEADVALFRAKHEGKNRVVYAEES